MTQPLAHVKLDILSDPICPWCYIGKTHLDRALADAPDHPFVVEWHPFQLNPDMPEGGMDRRAYLETKFGGKDNAVKVYAQIADHAREAGVEINFEAMQRTPNTINADPLGRTGSKAIRNRGCAISSVFCRRQRYRRHQGARGSGRTRWDGTRCRRETLGRRQ